ncbi:MAG: hypothetical protein IT323_00760 [Anaerolineae bacterium]|nr:hypothetical protein [Anaerolineae bacterium]
MRKVKVTVPAAFTGIGPGIESLGLALGLHNTVEMSLAAGDAETRRLTGELDGPLPADHPALRAARELFKAAEQDMPTADVVCHADIPPGCGLGDEAVWTVAGLFAANNLLETPMRRERIAALALDLCARPAEAVTALFGGLAITSAAAQSGDGAPLTYRRVELTRALEVVLAVPSLPHFSEKARKAHPERIAWHEALASAGRVALVAEGLRTGDFALLKDALRDTLREPRVRPLIPGFAAVVEAARGQGAAGVSLSGDGPALVCLARHNQDKIARAMVEAFQAAGVAARAWILHVDTQGVAINAQR